MGHLSTSRFSKGHVVDKRPITEPPEGHTSTALCGIPPNALNRLALTNMLEG